MTMVEQFYSTNRAVLHAIIATATGNEKTISQKNCFKAAYGHTQYVTRSTASEVQPDRCELHIDKYIIFFRAAETVLSN